MNNCKVQMVFMCHCLECVTWERRMIGLSKGLKDKSWIKEIFFEIFLRTFHWPISPNLKCLEIYSNFHFNQGMDTSNFYNCFPLPATENSGKRWKCPSLDFKITFFNRKFKLFTKKCTFIPNIGNFSLHHKKFI